MTKPSHLHKTFVAHLAERPLSMPDVRGSYPDTGKFYRTSIYCQLYCIEKTKIKEKEAGNGPFLKNKIGIQNVWLRCM